MQKLSIGVHKSELGKGFGAALGPMPRWAVGVGGGAWGEEAFRGAQRL